VAVTVIHVTNRLSPESESGLTEMENRPVPPVGVGVGGLEVVVTGGVLAGGVDAGGVLVGGLVVVAVDDGGVDAVVVASGPQPTTEMQSRDRAVMMANILYSLITISSSLILYQARQQFFYIIA
jgi:hypothetical protein